MILPRAKDSESQFWCQPSSSVAIATAHLAKVYLKGAITGHTYTVFLSGVCGELETAPLTFFNTNCL